jgi:hypothetical protein
MVRCSVHVRVVSGHEQTLQVRLELLRELAAVLAGRFGSVTGRNLGKCYKTKLECFADKCQ